MIMLTIDYSLLDNNLQHLPPTDNSSGNMTPLVLTRIYLLKNISSTVKTSSSESYDTLSLFHHCYATI